MSPDSRPPAAAPTRRQQGWDDAQDPSQEDLRPIIGSGAGDEAPRSRFNIAGWAGTGLTVALLGVAAFFGASAAEKEGDVNRLLTYRNESTGAPVEYASVAASFEEDMRVGRRDDRIAKLLFFSAAGAAIVSAALFVVDSFRTPPAGERGGLR